MFKLRIASLGLLVLTTFVIAACIPIQPKTLAAFPEPTAINQGEKLEGDIQFTEELAHYQGPNPYTSSPSFDVGYASSIWEYVADDGSGRESQLIHRTLPGCALWLRAGPVGTQNASTTILAGTEWTVGQVQPNILLYSMPKGDIAFTLGLLLPEVYVESVKSPCQAAAERVIETLQEMP